MDSIKIPNAVLANVMNDIANSMVQNSTGSLYVMKGAIPTATTMKAAATSYITSTRAADILISYAIPAKGTVTNNQTVYPQFPYTAATGTGTATWCALICTYSGLMIFGDVTDAQGSGFLRLNNTNIVTGGQYRVMSMTHTMPYEYTL